MTRYKTPPATRCHINLIITDARLAQAIDTQCRRTGESRAQFTRRLLWERVMAGSSPDGLPLVEREGD